ncbi:ABC transporter substrate-binding protein [Pigmentiphaga litoralis]|uniref:Bug family tripartite tricarboxylate transporter substrate binding protein n=1 Tax=Pigmentiphaga litoralis TaxID=516702 RepID=UPI001675298E|nr:tripartite tricarboxylate transporter substrate binding protein [Pigmentiphaga litoralis]GGX01575.1 ABC transporter substrate-binding protein [Pigmentiphaga litoralis]
MNRRQFLYAAAALGAAAAGNGAQAAQWPEQPLKIVNPYPPGGIVDILARTLAEQLAARLGKPVIVENRPGAGGNIGTAMVARARGDLHTLLLGASGPLAISSSLYSDLGYDSMRDFSPITLLASTPLVLVASQRTGIRTQAELVKLMRDSTTPLFFGSAGAGTPQHLAGELFKQKSGMNATHVPYKGGAPVIAALLGGEVAYAFENLILVEPHIASGKLTALAVTSPTRVTRLPDLPTVAENGLNGFEARGWYGLLAPAGFPQQIIDRLVKETMAIAGQPKFRQMLATFGSADVAQGPEKLSKLIEEDTQKWGAIIRAGNIKLDA